MGAALIGWQILIFFTIFISGSKRGWVAAFWVLWTLVQVYGLPLSVIQFLTIFFGYRLAHLPKNSDVEPSVPSTSKTTNPEELADQAPKNKVGHESPLHPYNESTTAKNERLEKNIKNSTPLLNSISEGLVEFNTKMQIRQQTQLGIAVFRRAINSEEIYLNALTKDAEHDQMIENQSAEFRAIYYKKYIEFSALLEEEQPPSDVFMWTELIKPTPVNDKEVQAKIDTAYEKLTKERNKRLTVLKDRCASDPDFKNHLVKKLTEAKYPYIHLIVPFG